VLITDIKVQKSRKNRFSIYIDGKYRFSLDFNTIQQVGLHVGDEIDEKKIDELIQRDEYARVRDYALLLLSYRDRSERELMNRLLKKGFHRDVATELVSKLKREGIIDDYAFAGKWVDDTCANRPMGRMKAVFELRKKMLADGIIEKVVEERFSGDAEDRLAHNAAEKKIKSLERYSPEIARERLYRFLKNRGFQFDIINGLMKEYFNDHIG